MFTLITSMLSPLAYAQYRVPAKDKIPVAFVITDEVYEHIVYAPHEHVYFAALPGMFERTISCSSLSKTYSITGWRIGYLIAPEPIGGSERRLAKRRPDALGIG